MEGALRLLARALGWDGDPIAYPWHELRHEDVRALPGKLEGLPRLRGGGQIAPRTANKALAVLRGVLRECERANLIPPEEYRRIEVSNVRGRGRPRGRALEDRELAALESALAKLEPRDAAALAVMIGCGLRKVEVERLDQRDYDPADGRLVARGKGGKERSLLVPPRWRSHLEAWWRTASPGPLFGLSRRQIAYLVERFCRSLEEAGVRRFTAHDLRRTFATRAIKRGDVLVAQRLLGHEKLDTTKIYDMRGRDAEDDVMEDL